MSEHSTKIDELIAIGKLCQERGWVAATSGNFSVVTRQKPLQLAITPSGVHKGKISESEIVLIDGETGTALDPEKIPSEETPIHLTIARQTGAGAVFHTHSIWGTILSERHAGEGGFFLSHYEMLKGLSGVKTHDHREWIPILENTQDKQKMALAVKSILEKEGIRAFLVQKHGLFTWGNNLEEAKRHLEVFEFLFEAEGTLGHRMGLANRNL